MCEPSCIKHNISECVKCEPARLVVKLSCIYCAHNLVNDKEYIGQHHNVKTVKKCRWNGHLVDAANGSKYPFHAALRKYKRDGFIWQVIWCGPIEKLNEKEAYYIKKRHTFVRDPLGGGYNMTKGGDGSLGLSHTRRTKKKMRMASELRWRSAEERGRASVAAKLRFEDIAERERLSITQKRRFEDPAVRKKTGAGSRRRFKDPAEREKMSIAMHHRYEDMSAREKISVAGLHRFEDEAEREKISITLKKTWAKKTPEERKDYWHATHPHGNRPK